MKIGKVAGSIVLGSSLVGATFAFSSAASAGEVRPAVWFDTGEHFSGFGAGSRCDSAGKAGKAQFGWLNYSCVRDGGSTALPAFELEAFVD
jgi:hypothetical protein